MTEQDRAEFEAIVSQSPYERSVERYPDDARNHSWPNGYREYTVQFAWDVCKEMLAARRTQSEQVRALVEAVDAWSGLTGSEDNDEMTDAWHRIGKALAQLKGQQSEQ